MSKQLNIPDFMRRSARAAKRAAVSLLTASGILVDVFAGFGGGSIASERAHGRPVDLAINHWPDAIYFHSRNHPLPTRHLTADIREVHPLEACGEMPVHHAHFSPDCRHYSGAKGGTPVADSVRALPWVILHWAKLKRPTLITMENVREMLTWGPTKPVMKGGKIQYFPSGEMKRLPDPEKKGLTFKIWLGRLKGMGYEVDWRVLDAADFGAPTHRRRLFLVARCDGKPVVWPQRTYGDEKARAKNPSLLPYRTAAECIDFSRPCPSIFMDREGAREYKKLTGIQCVRPLADKTEWRIANGVVRFVINAEKPFIIRRDGQDWRAVGDPFIARCAHGEGEGASKRRGHGSHSIQEPLPTVTASKDFSLVGPIIAKYNGADVNGRRADRPAATITTIEGQGLIAASMVQANHGGRDVRTPDIRKPLNVITGKHGYGVVAASLIQVGYGEREGQGPRINPVTEPINTVVSTGKQAVSSAVLVEVQNSSSATGARAADRPAPTIMANPKGGGWAVSSLKMVAFNLLEQYGCSVGHRVEQPVGSMTCVNHHSLTAAHLTHFHSGEVLELRASDPREPLPTQDTQNRFAVVAAFLSKLRGSGGWKPCDVPLDVVCAGAPTFGVVSAFITKFYGTAIGQSILKPLSTVTADAGGGHMGAVHAFLSQGVDEASLAGFWRVYSFLVKHLGPDAPLPMLQVDGHLFLIVDLGLRMLEPFELLNAQFTPEIAKDYVLPKQKSLAVKLIGNSVSPPVLEAVIRAQGMNHRKRRAA